MGDLDTAAPRSDKAINHRVSALFVILLVVFVYLFFALKAAEAESITVEVRINGLTTSYTTAYHTVGELVDTIYPPDQVTSVFPPRTTELTAHLQVTIQVKPVKVNPVVAANLQLAQVTATKIPPPPTPRPAPPQPKSPTYSGTATWYRFGSNLTTASTQFPLGTRLRVTADASGKYVDVTVNDYGPSEDTGVTLDLNRPAFAKLAPVGAGKILVRYYVI